MVDGLAVATAPPSVRRGFRFSRVAGNRTLHDSSNPTRLPSFIMGTLMPALETYQYTSLRPGDSTFRLLKLLKYRGPELECELFPQSLSNNEHISYEALSYVWGSTELVECIILDRKRHWITDNLYAALQNLRLHDRDRYLWVDAICIYSGRSGIKASRNQQPFI